MPGHADIGGARIPAEGVVVERRHLGLRLALPPIDGAGIAKAELLELRGVDPHRPAIIGLDGEGVAVDRRHRAERPVVEAGLAVIGEELQPVAHPELELPRVVSTVSPSPTSPRRLRMSRMSWLRRFTSALVLA